MLWALVAIEVAMQGNTAFSITEWPGCVSSLKPLLQATLGSSRQGGLLKESLPLGGNQSEDSGCRGPGANMKDLPKGRHN
jgi:hypothetical protein